jgi:hypothetical protein
VKSRHRIDTSTREINSQKTTQEAGFEAKGVRIDSGDLAYLSKEARSLFDRTADELDAGTYGAGRGSLAESLRKCYVVASNDINERVLLSLRDQGAKVDAYGIGTHLVTCQAQPALGCVYKLVEISGEPCLCCRVRSFVDGVLRASRRRRGDGVSGGDGRARRDAAECTPSPFAGRPRRQRGSTPSRPRVARARRSQDGHAKKKTQRRPQAQPGARQDDDPRRVSSVLFLCLRGDGVVG